MSAFDLKKILRFYFIAGHTAAPDLPPGLSLTGQVDIALQAGATIIQYASRVFSPKHFKDVETIRNHCQCNAVPFIVDTNILLAKAVGADGILLDIDDENPETARHILGRDALVGISVSAMNDMERIDLSRYDFILTDKISSCGTESVTNRNSSLPDLQPFSQQATVPVVISSTATDRTLTSLFENGADGIAFKCRASNPETLLKDALAIGSSCGCAPRDKIDSAWKDEFTLIRHLLRHAAKKPDTESFIRIPPGDDAALLRSFQNPVITTDTQKEGVHFKPGWQSPEEIGFKAVVVTLSDLAASYAAPVSLFINLSLPSYISENYVEALYDGVHNALLTYDCELGGGNISTANQLSLDLFAIGRGRKGIFPTRSGARAGDTLYSTGPLGLAHAGLDSLLRKDTSYNKLSAAFKRPKARFDAADVLAKHNVKCVMDISDGLAGDAGHIARASGISIELESDPSDFDTDLVSYCKKYDLVPEELILTGGEDYELLFACPGETFRQIKKAIPEAITVGRCLPFKGRYLTNLPSHVASYQHGRKD